ncbi:MAG: recombinase family protein [Limnochordia bacterium]|nr:recombinase family protein [Limnochordia bacterium]
MKAAIYCRVSTERQAEEGTSLESQKQLCLKYARQHGYDAGDRIFIETFTGAKLERPEMSRLLDYVKAEKIDTLIVYALDRFSRDDNQQGVLYYTLSQQGVSLVSVTEGPVEDTPIGRLILHVYGFKAEMERVNILERTARGKLSRAQSGKLPSGHGLFGYRYNRDTGLREVIESQAEVVRNVFSWYVDERLSIYAIAKRLIDTATLSRNGKCSWTHNSIYGMLKNSAYCGLTYANKYQRSVHVKTDTVTTVRPESEWILLPDATPPIISQEMFCKAQDILKSHVNSGTKSGFQYLFKGMLFCGICGRRFSGSTRRGKPFYHCNSKYRVYMKHCGNKSYAAVKLETELWEAIKEQLSKPDELLARIEQANQSSEIRFKLQANIDICNERIKQINQDVRNTIDVYVALKCEDLDLPDCVGKIKELKGQEAALKTEIESLQERLLRVNEYGRRIKGAKTLLDNIAQKLDSPTWEEKRQILIALDVRITTNQADQQIRILLPDDDDLFRQPGLPKQFRHTPIEYTFSRA